MSDSDDWEKNAEKDDEALGDILKTGKFGDEITSAADLAKQQANLSSAKAPEEEKKTTTKAKGKGKLGKKKVEAKEDKKAPVKAEIIAEGKKKEEIADNELADELFGVKKVTMLSTDDDYLDYAREVHRMLNKGQYHFRLPVFFNELFKETTKLMRVEEINKVISQLSVIHSERLKSEKGTKKTNNKPGLKADSAKKIQIADDDEENEYNEYEDFL
ncbi:hypothetical protein SteCoe_10589 [Stentor coeruleus]|uniref:Uncharacterized protein n=1 Tax=Stentor coeruleus TaxID=5963 RepID=A0A1R2CF91_9CILI|nr:hypothetical protein SteCoe_10589 [Stentor coeruleus]